jgi:hypothetical protein
LKFFRRGWGLLEKKRERRQNKGFGREAKKRRNHFKRCPQRTWEKRAFRI